MLPDDVKTLAPAVLAHRLLPSTESQLARRNATDVGADLLEQVAVPRSRASS